MAIFITALVISTVYAGYLGTFRVIRGSEYPEKIYSMARITMERMILDLESLARNRGMFAIAAAPSSVSPDSRDMAFISASGIGPADGNATGNCVISYFLGRDEKYGLVLWRSENPGAVTAPATTPLLSPQQGGLNDSSNSAQAYLMCTNLKSVSYSFYDLLGVEYDSWDSKARPSVPAPVCVQVMFEFENPNGDHISFSPGC